MRAIFSGITGRRILAVLVATLAAACSQGGAAGGDAARFQKACVEGVKERLLAPATFVLKDVIDDSETIEFSADNLAAIEARFDDLRALDARTPEEDLELLQTSLELETARRAVAGDLAPKLYRLFLQYDAANEYGTPIRRHSECDFRALDGRFDGDETVEIDGETNHRWLIGRITELTTTP